MSQELIYTSAPRGLKPGSRGFCTVASTQGIAINLAQRLESLSGYRHVYPPQDPNAHLNPVSNSHLHLTVGGRRYHVLSRICDIGLDYTQRTNKLAHHVVLNDTELVEGGPAWVLAQEGFMEHRWEGEPRVLPVGRSPAPARVQPQVCRAWQQHTGDAGWGGLLAEKTLEKPQDPITLIFRPGEDMLPLFVETLALLPPRARWSVTFSTYYTKLPPGIHCQWRSVIDGSPEATAARRIRHQLVIDLTTTLPNAAGGTLVKAARSGVMPTAVAPHVTQSKSPRRSVAIERPVEPRGRPEAAPTVASAAAGELSSPAPAHTGVAPGNEVGTPLAALPDAYQQPAPSAFPGAPPQLPLTSKRRFPWSLVLGIAVGSVVGVGFAAFLIVNRAQPEPEAKDDFATGVTASNETIKSTETHKSPATATSREQPSPDAADGGQKTKEEVIVSDNRDIEDEQTNTSIADDKKSSDVVDAVNVDESDIERQPTSHRDDLMPHMPLDDKTSQGIVDAGGTVNRYGIHDYVRDLPNAVGIMADDFEAVTTIGKVGLAGIDGLTFKLLGVENIQTFTNSEFEGPSYSDDGNTVWRCTLDNSDLEVTVEVAELLVDTEGVLRFRWLENGVADSKMLVNCVLRISVDGQENPKLISLRKPMHGKPLDLSLRSFRRSDPVNITTTRSVSNMTPALAKELSLEFEVNPPTGSAGKWRYKYTSDKDVVEKSIVIRHASKMLALRFRVERPDWSGKAEKAIVLPLKHECTIVREEKLNVSRLDIYANELDMHIYEALKDFREEQKILRGEITDEQETAKQTIRNIEKLRRRLEREPDNKFLPEDIAEEETSLETQKQNISVLLQQKKECDGIVSVLEEAGADSNQPPVPMIAIPYQIFSTVGTGSEATKIVFVENKGEEDPPSTRTAIQNKP